MRRLAIFILPAVALLLVASASVPAAASAAADPFANGCPKEALEEGATAKLNHNPAAKQAIVPTGATSLRICRYWGFGNEKGEQNAKTQARAGKLNDGAEVHDKALLEGLTYEFKELEAAPKGAISCPADDGTQLYAVFFYPHADPVVIHVSLSGCRFAAGAAPRAREMTASLEGKLVRLAKGEHVKSKPKHGEVKEKSVVTNSPPHLSYARAKHSAATALGFFCEESKLCATHSIGTCTRRTPAAFGCRYEAKLLSGEVCRGTMSVNDYGEAIADSPGVQSSSEGECFYLFAPPDFKEEMEEEEEREEAEEKERAKPSG